MTLNSAYPRDYTITSTQRDLQVMDERRYGGMILGYEALAFQKAPPLNVDFGGLRSRKGQNPDPGLGNNLRHRRRAYAERSRKLFQQMTADGAQDQYRIRPLGHLFSGGRSARSPRGARQ
jgi:hypothetical protein